MERANYSDIPSFQNDLITIRLGKAPHQTDIHVSESTLRKSSLYLNRALNKLATQSTHRTITLSEIHATEFSIYYQWLLTGKLHTRKPSAGCEIRTLVMVCSLGHLLVDTDFLDTVHDAIIQFSTEGHPGTLEGFILAGTALYDCIPGFASKANPFIDVVVGLVWKEELSMSRIRKVIREAFEGLLDEAEKPTETEIPKEVLQPKQADLPDEVTPPQEAEEMNEVEGSKDEVAPDVVPEAGHVERPARQSIQPKMPLFKGASEFAMRFTKVLGIAGGYSRKRSVSSEYDFDTRRDSATGTDMSYDFPKF
ncbi:hypothetical protein P3342_006943 [Pyrenophora teres f. teres]|uniref:Uncharacterized protein n=2 Tax=Pyrenophora teres f. teres TaxID=97479 RepID=E3RTT8_PYRTT|nr:hypothetical protein PTT_12443 [Pyrenophora teres f. teres 0-1]KAE8833653.1 hypothetical protein HRS9139_05472 [Pyrenophora teres f. teres]KAE8840580.1 hypothetical protein PTNB85_03979 [Pyrenophora teres f. teres]KAE8849281.1 hypothetical protein HRS9122_03297 [Pyrenophora teres f. teres]KAE8864074.1 hypothetical protein PTNB29_04038 [Pyrenophora teres f. teres]